MDREALLALYDHDQRINIQYPGLRKEVTGDVVRFVGEPQSHGNLVLYSRLSSKNVDKVIGEQVAYYQGLQRSLEWRVYDHDQPPDLRARLAMQGFRAREPEAIMVLETREASARMVRPVAADVRRLRSPEELPVMTQILQEVWGGDFNWLRRLLADDLVERPQYVAIFVAYWGDMPASCGWVHFHENSQFASLWGGTTRMQFRNQGLYTAVLAARVQESLRRGYRFLTSEATRMSRPIGEKHGFELLTFANSCTWEPAGIGGANGQSVNSEPGDDAS